MDIDKADLDVLKKFLKGKIIESKKEKRILEEYRKIGWIRTGIKSIKMPNGKVKVIPTASLTRLGKSIVKEALFRAKWKILYEIINIPA